jgi:hypothetical protein
VSRSADPLREHLRQITADARTGRQRETMPELLKLVNGQDAVSAWIAADALAGIMWWVGFTGAASDMVERVVLRFGGRVEADDLPQTVLFTAAVVAGGYYEGTEVVGRLHRMAGALPAGSGLQRKLLFAAGGHAADPTTGLPLVLGDLRPLPAFQQPLAAADPRTLTPGQSDDLWRAYGAASDRAGLIALHDAGCPRPIDMAVEWRLVQALYEAGRPFDAEAVLLAVREHWPLFTWWQTLPHTPVLNPGLRPVVTARVREEYLTLPVGRPED